MSEQSSGNAKKRNVAKRDNGLRHIEFLDHQWSTIRLQESSLSEPHLWIHLDQVGVTHRDNAVIGLFLSANQVEMLIPILQHYVDTYELPDEYEGDWGKAHGDGEDDTR